MTEQPLAGFVQGPTDLWYWDRLGRAVACQIGILNMSVPTAHMDDFGPFPPDTNQTTAQSLEAHLGSGLDEALQDLVPQK